jgi:hypothetical protein
MGGVRAADRFEDTPALLPSEQRCNTYARMGL